jgi:hypothetical protein
MIKLAKTGNGPHSSTLVVICVARLLFMLFYVLFVCKCVLYYCHQVATLLQLTNIYIYIYIYIISYQDVLYITETRTHMSTTEKYSI